MSNKSGVSSAVISLPKGGGALHGLGEKFSPDLHTGTGNFTVPIALPPGRNGFQPQLNLVYSTGNGNGPFGLGWSLSIPGVSRQTAKGIPRYDDSTDVFVLSGAEDLVPVKRPDGTILYRPRTEGLFARTQHHRDARNDYWEVRSKDGLVSFYGTPRTGWPSYAGRDPAVIADPDNARHIFAWKLSRTQDPFGNRIDYVYERDALQTDGPHEWDQLRLSEIRYVDYGDHAHPEFLVKVKFLYGDRPDPFSHYRAGFEIRTVQRCTGIEVHTRAGVDRLTRSYDLVYLDQRVEKGELPAETLPRNGVSLLNQVLVVGHDGPDSEALPPLEFGYSRFAPKQQKFLPITGSDLPPFSLAHPELELADLFGNGLPDILEMNGIVRYWRNEGDGRFALPREMRDAPAGVTLADPGVQLIDANGDGRIDLLVTTQGFAGYYPLRFGGLWDRRSFQPYRVAPSFDLKGPEVRLVDLTGDGVTDAIRSGSRLECFYNDPKEGWNGTHWVERRLLKDFPDINFSDPRVKWADMSGDGLQDIVLVYDGNVEYWPSLGYGNWNKRIHMKNSPRFPYGYDPKRILVGDVDGDGLADIVYVDDTQVTLWINQSGNGWSAPVVMTGTPPVSDMDAVRLVDLLGNGVSGVLWSADAGGLSRQNMFFLDFTGGTKPYLLDEMDNHMGALTKVEYVPSTRFYLEDQKRPKTRWRTPLPFPVQVVARVEVIDAISHGKLTTKYRYHHGYWDGAEREFRGFAMVEQLDTESFENYDTLGLHGTVTSFAKVEPKHFSAPTLTKTWFHQGPVGDEFGDWEEFDPSAEFWPGDPQVLGHTKTVNDFLKSLKIRRAKREALRALGGKILRFELYALDGTEREDRPYTVTETVFGLREEEKPSGDGKDRARIFFPHALGQRITQWERGNQPLTQFTFTGEYDDYGQPRSQISIAIPRGRKYLETIPPGAAAPEFYLATHTRTDHAPRDNVNKYIVDRVAGTTTYEIVNDGRDALFGLKSKIESKTLDDPLKVISQSVNFYDGLEFLGLPYGQIGDFGALVRTESLVLTKDILHEACKSGGAVLSSPEEPPYLATSGSPVWTTDYPQEFRTLLPFWAGYTYQPSGTGSEYAAGYFAATERRRYDFHGKAAQGRGLIRIKRDPLGHDMGITYDSYDLLPIGVTDAVGLKTRAHYDYRVLQPDKVTDANRNRTEFTFTPLGLPATRAVKGKRANKEGDRNRASLQLEYRFSAFVDRGQPVFVRTTRYSHHDTETDVPLPERDETIQSVEYSDGFGRLLQTRTQAEDVLFDDPALDKPTFGDAGLPADQSLHVRNAVGRQRPAKDPFIVVSGWQVYNNKGWVVEKYEPFFSIGWDYALPTSVQLGQKATMYYDPRGRVIRTVNPDRSEQRVIRGLPVNLDDPDRFTPTPWEAYTYDTNDNAGRTHPGEALDYRQHWNTPTSAVVDALGRTVESVERSCAKPAKPGDPRPPIEEYHTLSTYDIRGNLLTVTDALGRPAFQHVYDVANRPLRIESIDAGVRRIILDAAGHEIERRDSKGALILHAYNRLNRPIHLWARDDSNSLVTLRERLEYGDGGDPNQPKPERSSNQSANRLGKLHKHYDEAGLLILEAYDFKGNVLERVRRVISDDAILAQFNPPPPNWEIVAFRVHWESSGTTPLDTTTEYRTTLTYDALNRTKTMQYPQDVDGTRKILLPRYNRAAALEKVELDNATYVERITYNAKGQRMLIAYGNGVMTRYAYDAKTFRLKRMRTERYTKPDTLTYRANGALRQDFRYEYDLAGNITGIKDRTPGSGLPVQPDQLDRAFTYDPLYRLLTATGREFDTRPPTPPIPPDPPWFDGPRGDDVTKTRSYEQTYVYDAVGNVTRLSHDTTPRASFNRDFAFVSGTDRLASVTATGILRSYAYDGNGNLVRENTERHFEWDHSDRIRVYRTQTVTSEPTVHVQYLHDATGQRVKKLVRKKGQVEATVYIDGVFEHHRLVKPSDTIENNTLHSMDNQSHVALVRVGDAFPDDGARDKPVKYVLGDHLSSGNIVTDEAGNLIDREEFFPYGETSFGSFARKRYRFTGKERDHESGLYYHGARYYAPWLARWVSTDPAGMVDGANLYKYVSGNPLTMMDSKGTNGTNAVSNYSTVAGDTVFYHVVDWARERGVIFQDQELIDHVGASAAEIEFKGFRPSTGSSAKYGEGVYAFPEEVDAAALARGGKLPSRPYAAFKVDPETPVEYVNGETGMRYAKLKGPPDQPIRPTEIEWRGMSTEQRTAYLRTHAKLADQRSQSSKPEPPKSTGTLASNPVADASPKAQSRLAIARGALGKAGGQIAGVAGIIGAAYTITQDTPHFWEGFYNTDTSDLEYPFLKLFHAIGLHDTAPPLPPHMGGDPALYFTNPETREWVSRALERRARVLEARTWGCY